VIVFENRVVRKASQILENVRWKKRTESWPFQ
jgi:hypothetical protein